MFPSKAWERIRYEQSYPAHAPYLQYLYELLSSLTLSAPKVIIRKPDKRTGIAYQSITFKTRAMPELNYYHDLFYPGKKVVPLNIHEHLTPRALAFWIMDDGGKNPYNQTFLHTNSFSRLVLTPFPIYWEMDRTKFPCSDPPQLRWGGSERSWEREDQGEVELLQAALLKNFQLRTRLIDKRPGQ